MTQQWTDNQYDEFEAKMTTDFPKMFSNPYGGFAVGSGWWPIIESLCRNIQGHIDNRERTREVLLKNNPHNVSISDAIPQVVVAQIKEKFGGLRFYYDGGDEYISGMVRMAETWAGNTCEECGVPGELRMGGWIRTLCDHHEAERQGRRNETAM